MSQSYLQDPNAVQDYSINWSAELSGDTIATSTWEASAGITIEDDDNTTTTATIWVSGGTLGEIYTIANTVVTAAGRTYVGSIVIRIWPQ